MFADPSCGRCCLFRVVVSRFATARCSDTALPDRRCTLKVWSLRRRICIVSHVLCARNLRLPTASWMTLPCVVGGVVVRSVGVVRLDRAISYEHGRLLRESFALPRAWAVSVFRLAPRSFRASGLFGRFGSKVPPARGAAPVRRCLPGTVAAPRGANCSMLISAPCGRWHVQAACQSASGCSSVAGLRVLFYLGLPLSHVNVVGTWV